MRTKEETIIDMCYTYRHDYGLDKKPDDPPWVAGMTQQEREMLYKTMEQLYEHHIQPIVNHYEKLQNGDEVVLPKNKNHAEFMIKVGHFYLEGLNKNDRKS